MPAPSASAWRDRVEAAGWLLPERAPPRPRPLVEDQVLDRKQSHSGSGMLSGFKPELVGVRHLHGKDATVEESGSPNDHVAKRCLMQCSRLGRAANVPVRLRLPLGRNLWESRQGGLTRSLAKATIQLPRLGKHFPPKQVREDPRQGELCAPDPPEFAVVTGAILGGTGLQVPLRRCETNWND